MKNYLAFIILIVLCSCMDKVDTRSLTVKNNSTKDIYTIIHKINIEDDTINIYGHLGDFIDTLEGKMNKKIDRPIDWQWYIKKSIRHKFRFYIIEKDSVDKYGWEGIYAKNIYNKKYTLDIDDLDSLNWTIEYNGN